MDSFGCADDDLAAADDVFKGKGCCADMSDLDTDSDLVAYGQMGFVVRLRVHNGQEITAVLEHEGEAEVEFHQQSFVGVVHDLELIGEKDAPGRVRIVQMYIGLVNKHV